MRAINLKTVAGYEFGWAALRLTWMPVALLLLVGCDSPGDPQRIATHARAIKSVAADTTNSLLTLSTTLKLQITILQAIQVGSQAAKESSAAKTLTGFQSLAPALIGSSEALSLARSVRAQLKATVTREKKFLGEIREEMAKLSADRSAGGPSLGSSAKSFDAAYAELRSSVQILADFISQLSNFGQATDDLETSIKAMLRELDILARSSTIQEQKASIVRFAAFNDNLPGQLQNMAAALQSEISAKDSGLKALLNCFKHLDAIPNLPEDLSKEIRAAIKLLDDVSKGVSFSPKPQ